MVGEVLISRNNKNSPPSFKPFQAFIHQGRPGTARNGGPGDLWHGPARKIMARKNIGTARHWKSWHRKILARHGTKNLPDGPISNQIPWFLMIFDYFGWFLMISWKQKRCATSVRSFWRQYRAEISTMCQKTKVFVLGKNRKLPWKKYARPLPRVYAIFLFAIE